MPYNYNAKNMPFRQLGSSGLRVPVLSLGAWLTFGKVLHGDPVKDIVKTALDNGINMFDTAEEYASGEAEIELGRAFKELDVKRSDLVVTTKIYWGGDGPNDTGLSRKHVIEGTKKSLERLQLDYVDVIFAHRCDTTVPMEEIVRAFNFVVEQGWAFYWATSEWSAAQIEEAHAIAGRLGLIAPIAEQCKHHMFYRERAEKEYAPLYESKRLGTTVFSALEKGILTGKYNDGIPPDTRFALLPDYQPVQGGIASLQGEAGKQLIAKIRALTEFAQKELGCSMTHLALAWVAANPNTSTVILGASKPEQIIDNLKAIEVVPKLTPEVLEKIERILDNKPTPHTTFGKGPLDKFGRVNAMLGPYA